MGGEGEVEVPARFPRVDLCVTSGGAAISRSALIIDNPLGLRGEGSPYGAKLWWALRP